MLRRLTLCVSGSVFRVRSTQLLGPISASLLGRVLHHGFDEPVNNCLSHFRTPGVDHLWILERGKELREGEPRSGCQHAVNVNGEHLWWHLFTLGNVPDLVYKFS